jgi:N-acetylglutamate synthase-like GNAT family acetyltransferase
VNTTITNAAAAPVTPAPVPSRFRARARLAVRPATPEEAPVLDELIQAHLAEGHLLPRSLDELRLHAHRFVVAVRRGRIVGCAELAPLSSRVAEVRSLVVHRSARALGIGRVLVTELERRARRGGYEQLCAFAHDASYFVRLGFSLVPHTWVPEKIARDCAACPLFRNCGQHALVLTLPTPRG